MGGSQVDDIKVVDRVLELLNEAFGWVKSQVEAFFKLLWNNLSAALLGVKSIVTNCCQKLKQVLAGTNDLIDVGVQKLSEADAVVEEEKPKAEKPKAPHEEDPEGSLVDELKKLLARMMEFVGFLKENGDPGWRPKVENLKEYLYVVEGFIELLLQIYGKQVATVIVNLFHGYRIHKSDGTKQRQPQHQRNKAAYAIAYVMSSVTSVVKMVSANLSVSITIVKE